MSLKRILLGAALVCAVAFNASAVEKLPLEDFFKNPQFANFQLSPDGSHLAGLAPVNGRMNIVIFDLRDRSKAPWPVTGVKEQNVNNYMWANNDRLLFFMDKDGNESLGIFAVNKDGSMPRTLVEPAESQFRSGQAVLRYSTVLDVLRSDEDHVLVVSNERRAEYPDVFKMNIMNGRKSLVQRNPGNVVGWFTDWDGNLEGAAYQEGVYVGWLELDDESGEWKEVTRVRYDEPTYQPALIKEGGKQGYVTSNLTPDGKKRDKAALYTYDFEDHKLGELVYEHPEVDCCATLTNEKERDLIGVQYMVGKPEMVYLDERWKNIMAGIDQALPDTVNVISNVDLDLTRGVVASFSDVQPPTYYLYDFSNNSLELLAPTRPWIKPEQMAEMKPVEFEARDGTKLYGYLTVPKGSDGKDLPFIINPHGGPWARDGWGFNPEAQFLANRGYAVMQVNFRGSTGFGMEHLEKSRKQWGQAMQNDVTDAVKWAIEQGVADEDRVCIYGGSYGGYATMAGLAYTPELYKCGINYVGVTDLPLLFETMPDAWNSGRERMEEMVGDPETEREFLEEWSPSNHADKIRAPVFMAYGRRDPRVNIEHLEVMEEALEEAGHEPVVMVKRDEGHGYAKEENRFEYYAKMEEFLAQHIGSQAASAPASSP